MLGSFSPRKKIRSDGVFIANMAFAGGSLRLNVKRKPTVYLLVFVKITKFAKVILYSAIINQIAGALQINISYE